MWGGRRRIRSRSDVGVSPVRTQVRISTSGSPLRTELLPDAGQRRLQVAMNVVRQRLERRDIDNLGRVGQSAFEALPDEVIDGRKERRERLARAGRGGDQRMPAAP